MTPATLRAVGEALYGPRFVASLARALDVADKTVARWLSGYSQIPEGLDSECLALLAARRADALDAEAAIHTDRVLEIARALIAETGTRPDRIDLTSVEGISAEILDRVRARLRDAGWPA